LVLQAGTAHFTNQQSGQRGYAGRGGSILQQTSGHSARIRTMISTPSVTIPGGSSGRPLTASTSAPISVISPVSML